jgi:hypothetical protein
VLTTGGASGVVGAVFCAAFVAAFGVVGVVALTVAAGLLRLFVAVFFAGVVAVLVAVDVSDTVDVAESDDTGCSGDELLIKVSKRFNDFCDAYLIIKQTISY